MRFTLRSAFWSITCAACFFGGMVLQRSRDEERHQALQVRIELLQAIDSNWETIWKVEQACKPGWP